MSFFEPQGLLSSFHFSESSSISVMYNVQDFKLHLAGGIGGILSAQS